MQSSRVGASVGRVHILGWAVGLTAIMLGHGCFIQETNLNYCSNINGDTFCNLRHGDERPYCLYGSDACFVELTAEQRADPTFDGCLESEPPSECYSPCGGGAPQEERGVCVGSREETGFAESSTSGMDVESSGGTTSEVSADGTSSGDTSTDTGSTGPSSECGNGVLEDGEECDGTDLGDWTCAEIGFDEGTLSCTIACALDSSECRRCGNGILEEGEDCDGTDYGGQTCESRGLSDGLLGCTGECAFDVTGCTLCGDGLRQGAEQCDVADLGGQTCESQGFSNGVLACNPTCSGYDLSQCTFCGDGIREGNEICDGNDLDGENCSSVPGGYTGGDLSCSVNCESLDPGGCYTSACNNDSREPDEVCDGQLFASDWGCSDFGFFGGDLVCVDCQIDVSGCTNCGDGSLGPDEVCDDSVVGGSGCVAMGYASGALDCDEDCLGYTGCVPYEGNCCGGHDTGGCSIPPCVEIVCSVLGNCCMAWGDECATAASSIPECNCPS